MAATGVTGLSYADLEAFPEDHVRREIIDGELFVTASPIPRHQFVAIHLVRRLADYADEHGGHVLIAPTDLYLSDTTVVVPDLLYLAPDRVDHLEERLVRHAPSLVIEISSPSTRRLDLSRKREAYEHEGVPEYWVVDLDRDVVVVNHLAGDTYVTDEAARGETVVSPTLAGLTVDVEAALDQP